ncbi:MAG TPA: beta-ketoacyl-[acyl-carrier-protein] synthase family protein [Bacteroidales bacterium]|nr:beta-ketoacyl-[acyl-carrier-protein] synthase family protein [Bacteroidales bacterium]HPI86217.1 beta-ketoacyl-[acyl-carrier-protein] synthase family protein [Bacteroidales bacterium]HPM92786.1 beta-ketoacyl-[acyl-carrier-protein] synthase family protein [Bacteroidales bacterium]
MNRVVITGMGIYSTIGKNLEEVRESLYTGKSGIGFEPARKEMGFRSGLTGILERPQLKGLLDRRQRIGMAEQAEYAYISTVEALRLAGIDQDYLDKVEAGILFGNDSSAVPVIETIDIMRDKKDTALIGSGLIFQTMNSTITMNLSVIYKLKGINLTVSGACASGSHALGLAYYLIRSGLQECIIAGGGQEVNLESTGNFDALNAFSVRDGEPTKASRPFDRDRDGLVPSGGAATLILESYDSAVRRGAKILAEVIGYGFSSNGDHISVPNLDGPVKAMRMALKDAGLSAKEIGYINAHATSTPVGDAKEAEAIDLVFGDAKPWVSSTKSMTGHEMWMGGASEVIYSILMMQNNFIAPNINFENPDEYSAKLKIADRTIHQDFNIFLSNAFGFGGTNSTLIVRGL